MTSGALAAISAHDSSSPKTAPEDAQSKTPLSERLDLTFGTDCRAALIATRCNSLSATACSSRWSRSPRKLSLSGAAAVSPLRARSVSPRPNVSEVARCNIVTKCGSEHVSVRTRARGRVCVGQKALPGRSARGGVGGLGQCRIQLGPMPKSLRLRTRLNGGKYVPRRSLGSPLVNRLATVPTGWKFDGDPSRSLSCLS